MSGWAGEAGKGLASAGPATSLGIAVKSLGFSSVPVRASLGNIQLRS